MLPMVAAGEEARHAAAEARRRREFWGEREPVLTISLKELPVGFKRTDRLSLRIPQLTEKGFPPLPLRVIIQSKHSTDLGKQRAPRCSSARTALLTTAPKPRAGR